VGTYRVRDFSELQDLGAGWRATILLPFYFHLIKVLEHLPRAWEITMSPPTNLKEVLDSEIKCVLDMIASRRAANFFHSESGTFVCNAPFRGFPSLKTAFKDIYYHQNNVKEHEAALELRDAVLRLRRAGAFVAVPLWRVNTSPIGPHPVGTSFRFYLRSCG